jgi:peroxiredoxin
MKKLFATIFVFTSLFVGSLQLSALEVGSQAPDVRLRILLSNGQEVLESVNSLETGKKVLLDFFSTTCTYCQANLKNFRQLSGQLSDKASFIIVGIDRSESVTRQFAKENPDLNIAIDNKREAKKAYEIFATPTTIIIDENKQIIYFHEGVLSEQDKTQITNLIAQP